MEPSTTEGTSPAPEPTAPLTICPACGYPGTAGLPCDRCHGTIRSPDGRSIQPGRGLAPLDLVRGAWSLVDGGLMLFNRPEFAGKLRAPFLANLVVLAVVFFGLFFGLWELFAWLTGGADWGWVDWLRPSPDSWIGGFLSFVLASVTVFFVAPVLIETVMGPFLDPIAQVVEQIHGGPGMRPVHDDLWKNAMIGLRSSAQILAIQLVVLPLTLLLSLTGIGAVLAVVLAAFLNAVVWFDIPMARRGFGLRDRLRIVRHNWPLALGFGLGFQAGLLMPVFNILFLTPAAAAAVSVLYLRFEKVR